MEQLPVLADARPVMPDELDDRAQDGCELIVAIADALRIGAEARTALVTLYGEERVDQVEWARQTLLRDCRTVFNGYATIPTNYLLAWLHGIEGAPWKGWYGRGLDGNDLAKILRDYGIRPTKIRYKNDAGVSQVYAGYKRDDFEAAWERYLKDDDA